MAKKVTANGKTFTFDDNVTNDEIASAVDEYFSSKKKVETVPSASTSTVTPTTAPLVSEGGTSGLGITPSGSQGIPNLPGRVNPQTFRNAPQPKQQEVVTPVSQSQMATPGQALDVNISKDTEISSQLKTASPLGDKEINTSMEGGSFKKVGDKITWVKDETKGPYKFEPKQAITANTPPETAFKIEKKMQKDIYDSETRKIADFHDKVFAPQAVAKGVKPNSHQSDIDFYLEYTKKNNPEEFNYLTGKYASLQGTVADDIKSGEDKEDTQEDKLALERFQAELLTKATALKTRANMGSYKMAENNIKNYYQDKIKSHNDLSKSMETDLNQFNVINDELETYPKNDQGQIITDATNRKKVEELIKKQQDILSGLQGKNEKLDELKGDKDFNDAMKTLDENQANYESVSQRYYDLATKNPDAFKALPEYKALLERNKKAKAEKDYKESLGVTSFGVEEGVGRAMTGLISKLAYLPKSLTSNSEYGWTDKLSDVASNNIDDFNDEYIATPTEMDKPILEDGKWNVKYLPGKVAQTATDMAIMIALTKGVGTGAGALTRGALSGEVASSLGSIVSGYTMSAQGYYQEAKDAGMGDKEATSFSRTLALQQALLELVSPNDKLLSPSIIKNDVKEFSKILAKGASGTQAAKQLARNVLKKNLPEISQELMQTFDEHVNKFSSAELSKANENVRQTLGEQMVETAILTALTTTLLGGATGDFTGTKGKMQKQSLYMAAYAPDKTIQALNKMYANDQISESELNEMSTKIQMASQSLAKMGDKVPQEKKIETLWSQYEKDLLQEEAKKTDPVFQGPVNEQIAQKEEEIKQVLNEPSEVEMLDENIAYLQELEAEGVIDDNQKEELDNLLTQKKRVAPPTYAEGLAAVKAKANGVIGNVPKGVVINKEEVTDFNSESGNKLVSSDGEGLILYHNTNKSEVSLSEGHKGTVGGVFFTPKETAYEDYGDNKIVSVANIKNPYYARSAVHGDPEKIKAIKEQGYDAIINHPFYEYEKPKGLSPSEYIAQQNINNNVEGKDNRGDLDLSQAREIIVFDKANIKELGSINNKTREYSKKEGVAFETDKTEQRQPIELSVETPKVEATVPVVKDEATSIEKDLEFEKLNESDFDENGDLTDSGFIKAQDALKGIIKNISNKYKIPANNLLSAYNIKNGEYFSSLKGILNVGENRDIDEVIKIVKDISFKMFPNKIDELNAQINKHKTELLDSIVNNTPFKANKGLEKVVFALTDIDEKWNELKTVTKTEFTTTEEVKNIEAPTKKGQDLSKKEVELEPRFPGGMPRKMEFKDGEWKQNVGGDYTTVAKQVQEQAQKEFDNLQIKTKKDDQENKQRVPSEIGIGEKPIETKPIEAAGAKEISAGGVLQTQEEVKSVTETKKEESVNVGAISGDFDAKSVIPYLSPEINKFTPAQQLKFNQGTYEPVRIVGDEEIISFIGMGSKIVKSLKTGTPSSVSKEARAKLEAKYGMTAFEAYEKAKELAKKHRSNNQENIVVLGNKEIAPAKKESKGTSQSNKQPVAKPTKVEKVAEEKPIEPNKKEDVVNKEEEAAVEADKSVKEDEEFISQVETRNIALLKEEKDPKMIEQRAVTALAKIYIGWKGKDGKDKKITYSTYTKLKNKIEDIVEGKISKKKLEGRVDLEIVSQKLNDIKKRVKDKLLGEGYDPSKFYSAPGINPKVINDLIDATFNLAEKAIRAGFTIKEAVDKANKLIKSNPAYKAAVRNKQIDEKEFESKVTESVNEETEALKKAFEEEQKKRAEEKALDENAPIGGDIKTGREKERANTKMQKESGKLSEVFDRISDTNKKYKETSLSKSKEYIDTILDDFEANGELISLAEGLLDGREIFLPEVKHEAERLLAGRLYDLAKTKSNDPIAQDDILSKAAKLYTKAMEAKTLAATQTAAGRIGNEKISSSPELLTNMVAEKITEIQKGTITPEEVKKTAEAANEINNIFDMEQMKEQMKKDIMTEFGEKTFGSKEEAERFANFSKSLLTDSNDC